MDIFRIMRNPLPWVYNGSPYQNQKNVGTEIYTTSHVSCSLVDGKVKFTLEHESG